MLPPSSGFKVCRLVDFCVCISFGFEKQCGKVGDGVGIGVSSGLVGPVYWECCANNTKGPGVQQKSHTFLFIFMLIEWPLVILFPLSA